MQTIDQNIDPRCCTFLVQNRFKIMKEKKVFCVNNHDDGGNDDDNIDLEN
jgi:hypothetical protein